jgi:hypothetical protein
MAKANASLLTSVKDKQVVSAMKTKPEGFWWFRKGEFDEDKYVKKYMSIYGLDAVRGGSYSQMVLGSEQKRAIESELRTAEGACMRCGRMGHFAETCYARTDVGGVSLVEKIEPQKYGFKRFAVSYYESDSDDESEDDDACHRCGREGHWVSDCYARRHADGWVL